MKIGNYPEGYNLSLLNTIYHKPFCRNDKWDPGAIDLIIKDNNTGEKFLETVLAPQYEYYMVLDKYYADPNYYPAFVEKEYCKQILVNYRFLKKDVADRTGKLNEYFDAKRAKNTAEINRIVNTNPRVLMTDMDIEDNMRFQFSNVYENMPGPISKSYLDIEADIIDCKGDFVQPGECPINAVSLVDDQTLTIYSFLLRNDKNPLIAKFEEESKTPELHAKLRDFLIDASGGPEKAHEYKIDQMQVKFHFFDEDKEIDMLRVLFNFINNLKPDFVLAWNMAFDIPYIIQRIRNLGYKPSDIMCSPDFMYKEVSYFIDERNKNVFEERNDFCKISSYSVYMDQMIQFASRRKGRSAFANYKLDYIGGLTCGVKKLDYSHITHDIGKLPYLDYETFVFYNIMDTLVQYCIEFKTNDISSVYTDVLLHNTRYSKIHRQTVYLKNRATKYYYNSGYIIGNNVNQNTPKTNFPGAFVSDPKKNNSYSKTCINGNPIPVYHNADDFDYKALYPSCATDDNIAPNTIIAHVNIPHQVYKYENRFNKDPIKWQRESQYMDDLQSHCWIEFFHRWFNFAGYEEMYDDVIEYFRMKKAPKGLLNYHPEFHEIYQGEPEDNSIEPIIMMYGDRERELLKMHRNQEYVQQPELKLDEGKSLQSIYMDLHNGFKYSEPKVIECQFEEC